jgi:hypothetical protein
MIVVVVVVSINDVSKEASSHSFWSAWYCGLSPSAVGLSLTVDPHIEKVLVDKGVILLPLWIVLFDVG